MLITHAHYSKDATSGSQDAVGYMCDHAVRKSNKLVNRSPAPEILMGDPTLIRAAIRMAPGQHKYRSAVLSFAPKDVDVAAFNAGCAVQRGRVNHALTMWLAAAFAGIPAANRPPVLASTHTHTGRMEVNLLIPRWVLRADGKIRAYNPDPPGAGNRALREAVEDVLNHRFDWADPRNPMLKRLVHLPDWQLKEHAEAKRQGTPIPQTPRTILLAGIVEAVFAKSIQSRDDLLEWLTANGHPVHSMGKQHITIGGPDTPANQRMRLTGPIFEETFTDLPALIPQGGAKEIIIQKRFNQIRNSIQSLPTLWQKRADFNRSRFGLMRWPRLALTLRNWMSGPFTPLQIPSLRLDRPLQIQRIPDAPRPQPVPDGTAITGTPNSIGRGDLATPRRHRKPPIADRAGPVGAGQQLDFGRGAGDRNPQVALGNPVRGSRLDLIRRRIHALPAGPDEPGTGSSGMMH